MPDVSPAGQQTCLAPEVIKAVRIGEGSSVPREDWTHLTDCDQCRTTLLHRIKQRSHDFPTTQRKFPKFPQQYSHLHILCHLTGGGMGEVFVAINEGLDNQLNAVKILKPDDDRSTPDFIEETEDTHGHAKEQLLLESRIQTALIDIEEVLPVIVRGECDLGPFFAMRFFYGQTLDTFIDEKKLSYRQQIKLFARICNVMGRIHERGIVHRDLKPAHVLCKVASLTGDVDDSADQNIVFRVIDFGIAQEVGGSLMSEPYPSARLAGTADLGRISGTKGTRHYVSPEMACCEGASIGAQADVYSLGVMLHELLTGETLLSKEDSDKLFDPETSKEERLSLFSNDILPSVTLKRQLATQNNDTPSKIQLIPAKKEVLFQCKQHDLDFIVNRSLRVDPSERQGNAGELARELRDSLDGKIHSLTRNTASLGRKAREAITLKTRTVIRAAAATIVLLLSLLLIGLAARMVNDAWGRQQLTVAVAENLTQLEPKLESLLNELPLRRVWLERQKLPDQWRQRIDDAEEIRLRIDSTIENSQHNVSSVARKRVEAAKAKLTKLHQDESLVRTVLELVNKTFDNGEFRVRFGDRPAGPRTDYTPEFKNFFSQHASFDPFTNDPQEIIKSVSQEPNPFLWVTVMDQLRLEYQLNQTQKHVAFLENLNRIANAIDIDSNAVAIRSLSILTNAQEQQIDTVAYNPESLYQPIALLRSLAFVMTEKGQGAAAEAFMSRAATRQSNNYDVWLAYALNVHDLPKRLAAFNAAKTLRPNHAAINIEVASRHAEKLAELASSTEPIDEHTLLLAKSEFESSMHYLDISDQDARESLVGIIHYNRGKCAEGYLGVIKKYKVSWKEKEKYKKRMELKKRLELQLVESFEKAMETASTCSPAANSLATYFAKKDRAAAEKYHRLATEAAPKNMIAWHLRGVFHNDQRDYPAARMCFEKAHALSPLHPSPAGYLATTLDNLEEYELASQHYQLAIKNYEATALPSFVNEREKMISFYRRRLEHIESIEYNKNAP